MPISRTVSGLKHEFSFDELCTLWSSVGGSVALDFANKLEGTASNKVSVAESGYFEIGKMWLTHTLLANVPMQNGDRVRVAHKSTDANHDWALSVWGYFPISDSRRDGSTPPIDPGSGQYWYGNVIGRITASESWTIRSVTCDWLPGETACQVIRPTIWTPAGTTLLLNDWIDHFVVSTTQYLTVTGLSPGQKVAVYRASDNVKIVEATCAGGQTQVIMDIDAEDYPEYIYFKVYATDGITLIETTSIYLMCGGDSWYWVPPYGTLTLETSAFIIIRTGGTGSPTSTTITATLLTQAGAPAPNKTIQFTTSRGTVDPTSDVTDANGEATTTLTSTTHGIAVVKANWLGDIDVPAAVAWTTHHVFYNAEVGDANKKFQFFLEGIEYAYVNGSYSLSSETTPQTFRVQIPEWISTITRRGLVGIYRKGIKEFSGLLTNLDRPFSENPQIVLSGPDSKALLEDRVVTLKDYSAKTLVYILTDLLASYPCGITLGTVGTYPTTLTITFSDSSVCASIASLCGVIGWLYRVTTSNTLDLKSSFGANKGSISFVEGVNLFMATNSENYTQTANSVRMRGEETLVSTAFDASSIEAIGLIEAVAFQKSITAQATLDIAGIAELARRISGAVKISANVLDTYAVGSWGVDDWVTLTCTDNELSGTYNIVKITRDMKDSDYAEVEFATAAAAEMGELIDYLKRQLKDLSTKTTI